MDKLQLNSIRERSNKTSGNWLADYLKLQSAQIVLTDDVPALIEEVERLQSELKYEKQVRLDYPKVKDFLNHLVTGTKVIIEDDIIEDHVYFDGTVLEYINSNASLENLTLIQSSIKGDVFNVRALKDYEEEE